MGRTCSMYGGRGGGMNADRLVGNPEGTRSLGKPKCGWVLVDLGETGLVWLRIGTSGGLL
jgi:hypothetical protein